ncbi:hypothetical protein [Allohahella marinimesophila]|uniref:Triacylglycerol lipase n=1 Tax=Allohahella marinimesophila TaxID=1054972 RepID=A0ABP7P2H2_9GAMM
MNDIVFLAPGFLGFERFNNFSYFDARVLAALRAALQTILGGAVPVVALNTRPSSQLAVRQAELLKNISEFEARFGRAERIHLIGHSTGGVDAALLLNDKPLTGVAWEQLDPTGIRQRLRTVIPMAAPQWGTCLTLAPFVRVVRESPLRQPFRSVKRIAALGRLLSRAARSFVRDQFAKNAFSEVITDIGEAGRYVIGVLADLDLLDNLRPVEMIALRQGSNRDPALEVRLASVVTAAGIRIGEPPYQPEPLFRTLYEATAGEEIDCPMPAAPGQRAVEALRQALRDGRCISDQSVRPRTVDLCVNDGIVNTARQLVMFDEPQVDEELLAFAIADHLDVIGFYARFRTPDYVDSGLLLSGSGWTDEQFYELYTRIARCISEQIPQSATHRRQVSARP